MKGVNKYVNELVHTIGKSLHGRIIKSELSTKMRQSVFIIIDEERIRFNKQWVIRNDKEKVKTIVNYAVYNVKPKCEYEAYSMKKIKEKLKN